MSEPADALGWHTLELWARRQPQAAAMLATGDRPPLRWGDLPACIAGLARRLEQAGAGRGARIAFLVPAGAEAATLCLAAMRTGIAVPLNPELTAAEIASALRRLRPHLLVFRPGLPGTPEAVAASFGVPTLAVEWSSADVVGWPRLGAASGVALAVDGDDPLAAPAGTRMILQTSGTTAQPKLVPLTETNLFAAAAALIGSLGLTARDRGLNLLPQFHIGGLWDLIAAPLLSGGSLICAGAFSRAAFEAGCGLAPTWTQLVPSMIRALVDAPLAAGVPPSSLRFLRSVSAPLPPALKDEAAEKLGVPIVEIYGMTETAGVIASNPLEPALQRAGSVGRCVGPDIVIRRPSGEVAAPGEEGEVVVRGPQVSPGYLAAAAGDAAVFGADGFHTGDLGRLDADGHLWLLGRLKDLINRGGEKISPAEIEAALLSLDGIADAAAFAVPHPMLGEEIEAALVPAPSGTGPPDLDALRAALRPLLGHGRVPARLHIVEAIPRTAGGKLQRHLLVARFATAPVAPVAPASPPQDWPRRPLARWVAGIWAGVLGKATMGGAEDFFQCGGTSLQAAQAATLIQARFPEHILYVSSVYEAPTPDLQATFLATHYPELAARAIGQEFHRRDVPVPPLTDAERALFRRALADPLPSRRAEASRNPPAVFVLSPPRSGSTLLRAMLAGHTQLFAPPELYLLSHPDLAARRAWYGAAHGSQLEGLPRAFVGAMGLGPDEAAALVDEMERSGMSAAAVYRRLQAAIGTRRLVDKTPFYGLYLHVLNTAEALFDGAVYIHLSRHPYGMIRSFDEARLGQLWWPRLAGPGGDATCPLASRQLAELIWASIHANVLGFLDGIPAARQVHLRYEDLVEQPEAACARLCTALGLDFEPAMLDPLGDPAQRMTDGLRPGSRMIGDPKFHAHRGIDRESAHRWKRDYDRDFLCEETWRLAERLGHGERLAEGADRIVFEI